MSSVVNMSENTLVKLKTTLKVHFETKEKSQGDPQHNQGNPNEQYLLSKMVTQLEDRVEEQSKVIKHLINTKNSNIEVKNTLLNENNENNDRRKRINSSSNVPQNNKQTKMNEPTQKNEKEKNTKKTNIEGSAIIQDANDFQAAPKKAWLFIGRAQQTTTKEKLENYLAKKIPNTVFEVEEIKKHSTNNNKNKSFKVGLDFDLLDEVLKPELWPKNLLVRRYIFFRTNKNSEL
ncbi:unnamed protein product [Brassicogethes aeneus]|uniref:Uncharacterized protein n=1 Tax=Brassicogethes aeneus TaxID=1431903 RepID=A0A9P0FBB5_BRAAE|nr:unnamed protein product [Brassicogethes aeneus]